MSENSGFMVVNKGHMDWELEKLGIGDLFETREEAEEDIKNTIHKGFQNEYAVREVVDGKLV